MLGEVRRVIAGLAVVMTVIGIGAAPARAATRYGCPAGRVCIYPQNAGWNGNRPSLTFYYYGTYNLSNQFGTHRMFNNQTGGLGEGEAYWCHGYNGGGLCGRVVQGDYDDLNFTPINSIVLCCDQTYAGLPQRPGL